MQVRQRSRAAGLFPRLKVKTNFWATPCSNPAVNVFAIHIEILHGSGEIGFDVVKIGAEHLAFPIGVDVGFGAAGLKKEGFVRCPVLRDDDAEFAVGPRQRRVLGVQLPVKIADAKFDDGAFLQGHFVKLFAVMGHFPGVCPSRATPGRQKTWALGVAAQTRCGPARCPGLCGPSGRRTAASRGQKGTITPTQVGARGRTAARVALG